MNRNTFSIWMAAALVTVALLGAAEAAEPRKPASLSPVTFRAETAKDALETKRILSASDRHALIRGELRREGVANMGAIGKAFAEGDFLITDDTLDITNPRMAVGSDAWFIAAQWTFSETDRDIVGLLIPFEETAPIVSLNIDATPEVDSFLPAVAFGPEIGLYLVVWEDFDGTVSNIYGAFVDENGAKASDSFLVIGTQEEEFSPTVAYAGEGDFVVFYGAATDYSLATGTVGLYATRVNVTGTGEITFGEEALVAEQAAYPRAAQINEENVIVAYQQLFARRSGPVANWDWDTAARVVNYEGVPAGPARALSETEASETYPSVAYNPKNRVAVVAYEYFEGNGTDRDIDVAVIPVSTSGVLGTPVLTNVFDSPNFDGWTDIAWDGVNDTFLLAWQHDFEDQDGDIYALELDAGGTPVGDVQAAIQTEAEQLFPAVGALDGYFLVAWQELIAGSYDLVGRFYLAGATPPPGGRVVSIPQGLAPAAGILQVPIHLDDAAGVLSFRVAVCYPPELKFIDAKPGTLNPGWTVAVNNTGNTVVLSGSGPTALSGGGSVGVLRFNVPTASQGGVLTFCEPSLNKLNDGRIALGTPQPGSYAAASPAFTWGDLGTPTGDNPAVACDGVAGGLDAALILRWDVGLTTRLVACPSNAVFNAPAFPPGGDVNGDGVLGGLDASLILRYDAGSINCFPADSNCDGMGPKLVAKQAAGTRNLALASNVPLPGTGQQVAIPVTIDDASGLLTYRLAVNFPTGRLAFVRAENGALTQGWLAPVVNVQDGRVTFSSSGAEPATGSGRLVTLHFEVIGTSGGTTLSFGSATRLNDGTVPVATQSGSVVASGSTIEVTPSGSIDFGVVATGQTVSRAVTVRNTGTATYTGSVRVSGQGFSLASAATVTLAPNATTTVTVRFAPGIDGDFSGSLELTGAQDGPTTIALQGSAATSKTMGCSANGGGPAPGQGDIAMLGLTALVLGYFMRRRAAA
jgi:MYXO-CTERM domain-containing protein